MQHSIKDSIKEFLQTHNLEEKIMEVHLQSSWEKLMGKTIAGHTTKIYIKNKKLHLRFDSPALKQELTYAKEKVINSINEEFKSEVVTEIVIS